jgi:hypothetical protein
MRRFSGSRRVLLALLPCLPVFICSAASVDQKLLSLIPPAGQIVARIGAPSSPSSTDNFVLVTHNCGIDLNDFYALSGVDSTRVIHELIFVAAADTAGPLSEHSLLASGNFDRDRIYRSAVDNGSSTAHYRGISVLVVQPFAREWREFSEVRWLAIPASDVLLFGSIASVQQELDRYLTRSSVDSRLAARLNRLRRDDATWSVLSQSAWNPEIRSALAAIDPELAAGLKDGDAFQFGIHYGRHVEFEYEITTNSSAATRSISDTLTQSLVGPEKGLALLPPIDMSTDNNTVRGIIRVSMTRYNAWLAEVSARGKSTVFR